MVDVEVAVSVVAVGTDKHDPISRQVVDELVAQRGAIWGAPLRQAPAVVDDQTLAVGLSNSSHPLKGVQGRSFVDHERREQQFRGGRHPGEPDACPTSCGDAGHVGSVGGVAVHVGRVAPHRRDVAWNIRFSAVSVATGRRPRLAVLVPHRTNARRRHGGVVKHGMRVVEAPVQDPHQHAFAVEGLGQIQACVDAVDTGSVAGLVDVGHRARGELDKVHGKDVKHVEVKSVDPEGGNARTASACEHEGLVFRPGPPGRFRHAVAHPPQEPHRRSSVRPRHRMPLSSLHERFGLGMGFCEFNQLVQGELVGGGQGLGLRREDRATHGGQEEDT